MLKHFKNLKIREYRTEDRSLIENFREQSFKEGNNSLSLVKYNPDSINGKTWLAFFNARLVSISVCEASHYTGDPEISARICRCHILKKYRHCNGCIRILPYQVKWAKAKGFKLVYWTCDVRRKALNMIYQHKRHPAGKSLLFNSDLYNSFQLEKNFLFKVSPHSPLLQYVYIKNLEKGYQWMPKTNVVWKKHNGDIDQD